MPANPVPTLDRLEIASAAALPRRFARNPLLRPGDIAPSRPDAEVTCVFNPGAFTYRGRVGLVLRVAERPVPEEGIVATFLYDAKAGEVVPFRRNRGHPDVRQVDPRGFDVGGKPYLTTLSHLAVVWSDDDGITFSREPSVRLFPQSNEDEFGLEDCRVTELDGVYHLTYSAVSARGVAVGHTTTADWRHFTPRRLMLPPANKDCALFPGRVDGRWWAIHRPDACDFDCRDIWIASSPDGRHWGEHHCLVPTRPGTWDGQRIGAGGPPIETPAGWLCVYHGADARGRYCLGSLLLDHDNPARVVARSRRPVMEPEAPYELSGFVGDAIFTNGHVVAGDRLRVYYGAADSVVAGADFSLRALLAELADQRVEKS